MEDLKGLDIGGWVREMWETLGEEGMVLFMTTCWMIWRRRNEWVFENRAFIGREVAEAAMAMVMEKEIAGENAGFGRRVEEDTSERGISKWLAPSPNTLKINVDAGLFNDRGVGIGIVARNEKGEAVWSCVHQKE
ncbi:hypothetical protein RND81_02G038200 [Saponaria officinalis]|uniref:RNase H type-1 domain-containing protein n=1 Tax=Saponaria officinalis TaxID=3572 RepID=A0AAW1MMK6_SAPOF